MKTPVVEDGAKTGSDLRQDLLETGFIVVLARMISACGSKRGNFGQNSSKLTEM
jgi:hypothetical protein